MTNRTCSGRSAAVINAAAAPVLAPNNAKGSWAVSSCCPSQSAAPVNLFASRAMSVRSSAGTQVDLLLLRRQQVQQQGCPAALLKDVRHPSIPWTVATAATSVGEEHNAAGFCSGDGKITVE